MELGVSFFDLLLPPLRQVCYSLSARRSGHLRRKGLKFRVLREEGKFC